MVPKPVGSEDSDRAMAAVLQRATTPQRAPVSAAGKRLT